MGHSNTTPNWEIPQFSSNDIPSWIGDVNQIVQKVEQGLNAVKIIGQDANTAASGAQATANALTPRVAANEQGIEGLLTVTGSQGTAIAGLDTRVDGIDTRVTVLEDGGGMGEWEEIPLSVSTSSLHYNKTLGLLSINVRIDYTGTEDNIQIASTTGIFTSTQKTSIILGQCVNSSDVSSMVYVNILASGIITIGGIMGSGTRAIRVTGTAYLSPENWL